MNVLHLDLKGLQPEFNHLLELLPIFRDADYDALLVEWEDCFPWTVDTVFRSRSAYTPEEICDFVHNARKNGLEIIPLVQTLGHMETFLGHPKYAHLRERENYSDVLNPIADGAADLVQSLIDDVLKLCPDVRYFHIGGDEAASLGTHSATNEYCNTHGVGNLFMYHFAPLMDRLNDRGIRPMIWHDMLINWSDKELLNLKNRTDIVFWGYGAPVHTTDSHYNINYIRRFSELGLSLWGATAYKGADGNTCDLPVISKRIKNAKSWFEAKKQFGLQGIFATGWSRYSTHRPQCEPIDAALDSMFIVSDIIRNGGTENEANAKFLNYMRTNNHMKQFETIKNATTHFSKLRDICWIYARYFIEQCTLEETLPGKRSSRISELDFASLKRCCNELAEAGKKIESLLHGLIVEDCLNEYINLRIDAIEKVMDLLSICEEGGADEVINDVVYNGKTGVCR